MSKGYIKAKMCKNLARRNNILAKTANLKIKDCKRGCLKVVNAKSYPKEAKCLITATSSSWLKIIKAKSKAKKKLYKSLLHKTIC